MEKQYVATDLHRRRSLIVRANADGEELGVVRIDNDPVALSLALAEAGPNPEVATEALHAALIRAAGDMADRARRPSRTDPDLTTA